MFWKTLTTMIFFTFITIGTAIAGDCARLWPHVTEAKANIIESFTVYDLDRLEHETQNLIFWDTYIQIECERRNAGETPVMWLSRQGQSNATPYTAGFLFWAEDLKEQTGLDITPMGLVRGRRFD